MAIYSTIKNILYNKDSAEEIFRRFSDVDNVQFNIKAFERKWPGIEKEIKEVDESMRPDYSRLNITFDI